MAAESLDVKSVVVSFAKSPLVAAARPLPTERESQDIFVQQAERNYLFLVIPKWWNEQAPVVPPRV